MKIVIDARMINSSTGRYVERLLAYLEKIDATNEYTVLVPSKDLTYWTPTNPRFTATAADFAYYSVAEQTKFLSFLNTLQADLVHFTMPQQPVLYRRPHVTTIHDLTLLRTYNSDKNWFVYHIKQLVGRFVFFAVAHTSRTVITPSNYTKRDIQAFAHIPESKIVTTYEAADALAAEPKPYELSSAEYLLYVGQQSDYKNVRRLILAHQELLRTHPNLLLVLVGSKNKAARTNEAWATKQGFTNVLFTGFVDDGELAWLYAHTACYVFPSLMEGFGLPGLEAMVAGSPVASSNTGSLPEIYGDAAHYFNPRDEGDMVTKIGQVLTDTALKNTLVTNGRRRAAEYSWERMAQQTLAIYQSVTGS